MRIKILKNITLILCFISISVFSQGESTIYKEIEKSYKNNNYKKALETALKSANKGNKSAEFWVGKIYDYGKGVTKDYKKAIKWYGMSAEQGFAKAQSNLAYIYLTNKAVKDYKAALKLNIKAAEQGNIRGQNNLAYTYEKGLGTAKDYKKAVKWYRKAAEQEDTGAQKNLAVMYNKGLGVAKDYKEALKWYRKAAEQGNTYFSI